MSSKTSDDKMTHEQRAAWCERVEALELAMSRQAQMIDDLTAGLIDLTNWAAGVRTSLGHRVPPLDFAGPSRGSSAPSKRAGMTITELHARLSSLPTLPSGREFAAQIGRGLRRLRSVSPLSRRTGLGDFDPRDDDELGS